MQRRYYSFYQSRCLLARWQVFSVHPSFLIIEAATILDISFFLLQFLEKKEFRRSSREILAARYDPPEYSSELLQRVWGRTASVRTSLRSSPKILSRTNTTRSSRLKQATTLFLFSSLSPPRWRSLLFTNLFFYTLASLHINYLSFASSSKKLNIEFERELTNFPPPTSSVLQRCKQEN